MNGNTRPKHVRRRNKNEKKRNENQNAFCRFSSSFIAILLCGIWHKFLEKKDWNGRAWVVRSSTATRGMRKLPKVRTTQTRNENCVTRCNGNAFMFCMSRIIRWKLRLCSVAVAFSHAQMFASPNASERQTKRKKCDKLTQFTEAKATTAERNNGTMTSKSRWNAD